jgi:hypothetical protein
VCVASFPTGQTGHPVGIGHMPIALGQQPEDLAHTSSERRRVTATSPDPSTVAYRAAVDAEQVAHELYALHPEQFTTARNARAKEAKAAGDRETAARIGAFRKPTVLAWLVNLLVRELPNEIGGFLDLGDALRDATATLSGPELRQLSGSGIDSCRLSSARPATSPARPVTGSPRTSLAARRRLWRRP